MFIDIAKITVKSGSGGNGAVSFHREKYVAAGGPDGGDGGRGGDVILRATKDKNTLLDFRYTRKFFAPDGEKGRSGRSSGKSGEHMVVVVPAGTLVKDADSEKIIADLRDDGQEFVIAKGGNGGFGNARFATPTRQAPKFAKPGIPGVEREVILELKLIADVGLLGFPNVGKSTFLSVVSDAKPKIANYHFTTLIPNLGVVSMGYDGFVIADIPGIIEGAAEGVGLGHEFLRHVERTRILIHIIDVSGVEGRDPLEDFDAINSELEKYSPKLAAKSQIIAANKSDLPMFDENFAEFKETLEARGYTVFAISAATKQGVTELLNHAYNELSKLPIEDFEIDEDEFEVVDTLDTSEVTVTLEDEVFYVEGGRAERLVGSVNFDDYESLQYFQRALRRIGIIDQLKEAGAVDGSIVHIYGVEFEYAD